MTLTEATGIAGAVRYLADNEQFPFASIYWQMDANFWYDYHQRDFGRWLIEYYNPGYHPPCGRLGRGDAD